MGGDVGVEGPLKLDQVDEPSPSLCLRDRRSLVLRQCFQGLWRLIRPGVGVEGQLTLFPPLFLLLVDSVLEHVLPSGFLVDAGPVNLGYVPQVVGAEAIQLLCRHLSENCAPPIRKLCATFRQKTELKQASEPSLIRSTPSPTIITRAHRPSYKPF